MSRLTPIVNIKDDIIHNMKLNSSDIVKKLKENKKRKREVVSFSISAPVYQAFKAKCEKAGLSASEVVQELMIAFNDG